MLKNGSINYDLFIQKAMRQAIRDLLRYASEKGIPENHYFYIEFLTHFPGVSLPENVREEYPQDMMICLQYEFWDLKAEDDAFSVTLIFDDEEYNIVVPYASILKFSDPSVDFGIEFSTDDIALDAEHLQALMDELDEENKIKVEDSDKPLDNVVSFSAFKKDHD
ncbi:MAG: hypothetical protein C0432_05065 [Candidatus Puniceispirillum sp.]|nr:hypothetical protein [Candidatus Pelagibacter sp.]MBA4283645.1 hypothetical protein [Candidatus Puniceispirillum sp.]